MGSPKASGKRQRGEIETLPSGSLRVRVYAGIDPLSRKRHYLISARSIGLIERSCRSSAWSRSWINAVSI